MEDETILTNPRNWESNGRTGLFYAITYIHETVLGRKGAKMTLTTNVYLFICRLISVQKNKKTVSLL
jgi:hypothetical protein